MTWRRRITEASLRFLAHRLNERRALYLFKVVAERFHVEEVLTRGELGRVQGKLDDRFVFGRYLRSGTWFENLTAFLTRSFEQRGGGTFIDIGANMGLVTIPVARLGNVDCKCFEPEPENLELLRGNLERNCPPGSYEIFPIALYREETTVDLEISAENRGDHRIRSGVSNDAADFYGESRRGVVSVRARPLDQVLDHTALRRPLIVKADAQGAELDIYVGGAATFARADAMLMEFWPYGLARMGSPPEKLIEHLVKDFDLGLVVGSHQSVREEEFAPIGVVAENLRSLSRAANPIAHVDVAAVKRSFLLSTHEPSPGTAPNAESH